MKRRKKKCELIHRINGVNYIPIDVVFTSDSKKRAEKMTRLGAITYKIKKIQYGGFLRDGYVIITFLVPVKKMKEFDKI